MIQHPRFLICLPLALACLSFSAPAVTFTTNTFISVTNAAFDSQDIEITNCTVTIDGPHSFSSVQIEKAGVLTHTFFTNGLTLAPIHVTNELQVLSDINPPILTHGNVSPDSVVITDTNQTITYTQSVDYMLAPLSGGFYQVLRTTNSAIADGSSVFVTYDAADPVATGINLTVSNNFEIEVGGAIDVNGIGYGAGLGPGAGRSAVTNAPYFLIAGSGGGNGGYGGLSATLAAGGNLYGNPQIPSDAGSGGGAGNGPGGSGGGRMILSVGGTLRLDGQITGNGSPGTNSDSGGGSGGSLWIASAQILTGSGSISANGGAGEPPNGGGGGGGRISIHVGTNLFAGTISAHGGTGFLAGGAGTVFIATDFPPANGQSSSRLLVDNGGLSGTNTAFTVPTGADLIVTNGAIAQPTPSTLNNLTVASNSFITGSGITLTIFGQATISAGGGIVTDGKGYAGGSGPGSGGSFSGPFGITGGGGGYGAFGGGNYTNSGGGLSYGFGTSPTDLGSGGGAGAGSGLASRGGAGGGSVQLSVSGQLTLDGRISANGLNGTAQGSGGGAGGSVNLHAGFLAGAGTISANGGAGEAPLGGGGSGGRIAVYAGSKELPGPFMGAITAYGGAGAHPGGAGTIFTLFSQNPLAQIVVDNHGLRGANTPLPFSGTTADVTVTGGGSIDLRPNPSVSLPTIHNLTTTSNGWITASSATTQLLLPISGNLVVQNGGGFLFDGKGFTGGTGPGPGQSLSSPSQTGGGAGHLGYGGQSVYGAAGGNAYDTLTSPTQAGSGGGTGAGSSTNGFGGAGGGALRLNVTGNATVDGLISVNGLPGVGSWSGGGSGGSIYITSAGFGGHGTISANGGAGDPPNGGGGGGGAVAIYSTSNSFAGVTTAYGGAGATRGGAGTIYSSTSLTRSTVLTVDNGGAAGTNTLISTSESTTDLRIAGGAIAIGNAFRSISNLVIASNSWLTFNATGQVQTFTVNNSVTVQSGGGITLDGQGNNQLGVGTFATGSGGGHGGYGGNSATNRGGGLVHGSLTAPVDIGSPGGSGFLSTPGANGGGALHLIIGGPLTLDGSITANGGAAQGTGAGGGSGGSLWIAASRLSGGGVISANGGAGDSPNGGGGGGGRVSLSYSTNIFAGLISARGGAGANYGGAGTIYLLASNTPFSKPPPQVVVVDNGGIRATNTPVTGLIDTFDLNVTGAGQATLGGSSMTLSSLLISSNSLLTFTSPYTPRIITINSNATIQAGGALTLDGEGSTAGTGAGPGGTVGLSGGGGGHGGYGGASSSNATGGIVYDSITSPTVLGSGGGGRGPDQSFQGGAGGGALHLTVLGTLSVDGALTANGLPANAQANGGGSGGSLWLGINRLTGAGVISANGGSGDLPAGGGGGGGRIAVITSSNQFTGAITTRGGPGAGVGGAGTIYLFQGNRGTIIVDNGGPRGGNTPLSFTGLSSVDFTIGPGGSAVLSNQNTCVNLLVSSNAVLLSPQANLTVTSNATIQAGGAVILDGLGFAVGGPGAGASGSFDTYGFSGGGGGHAGYGGSSWFGAAGGNSYDSLLTPNQAGSAGGAGNGSGTNAFGGAGGGPLQFNVTRTLTCNGTISANGLAGVGQWSGGGAGGSIWISAATLAGSGLISANGGAGDPPYGGGGGGGRIALYFNSSQLPGSSNQFTGNIVAHGGSGATFGGAGTIVIKTNNVATYQFVLDNGGTFGTNTPISFSGNADLTARGGAIGEVASSTSIRNILIESNSWLNAPAGLTAPWSISASNNVTVKAGGGISADGRGYSGGSGPGAGGNTNTPSDGYTGGGGGYGGYGAQSIDGASGGNSYGAIQQPGDRGSGGGSVGFGLGAAGGGALLLNVSNNLVLDGRISANGFDAPIEGTGGGSGGSVLIRAGTLSGTGSISANGGNGDYFQGGGGGGGRMALYYGNWSFQGALTAHGGLGALAGGAGTIYSKANVNTAGGIFIPQLLIDNNGATGTNTPIPGLDILDLTVRGGAAATPQVPLTLNSLFLDSGAVLTQPPLQSGVDLLVLTGVYIGTNAGIAVDGKGYTGSNAGPGAGTMPQGGAGSGAGYGGAGGASATGVVGGTTYGSAFQPTDLGSSGGYYLSGASYRNLSQGGGAVRLRVSGSLTLEGRITANGNDGTFPRSGAGSGGSIWLTARTFAGHGFITANGGMGELFDGGGGGGGRIAINCTTKLFTGPVVALGGYGYNYGADGTVIITNIPPPTVVSQIPVGVVSYTVSNVDITFGSPMNFTTASPSDMTIYTPVGELPDSSITVTPLDLYTLRVSFPPETTVGYYEIDAGPAIEDIYGVPMDDPYVGSFVITSPIISGRVLSTNGAPVSFVTLRAGSGLQPAVTDSSGQYSLEVPPGWSGTITPSKGSAIFIPASRSYTNVSSDATNQNFISTTATSLALHSQRQGNGVSLNWFGINGVTYQTLFSTNLVDWLPYGPPVIGTNGPASLSILTPADPTAFFRFSTSY